MNIHQLPKSMELFEKKFKELWFNENMGVAVSWMHPVTIIIYNNISQTNEEQSYIDVFTVIDAVHFKLQHDCKITVEKLIKMAKWIENYEF